MPRKKRQVDDAAARESELSDFDSDQAEYNRHVEAMNDAQWAAYIDAVLDLTRRAEGASDSEDSTPRG